MKRSGVWCTYTCFHGEDGDDSEDGARALRVALRDS